MAHLIKVLTHLKALTTLTLDENNLGRKGMDALGKFALPNMENLTSLSIRNNNICAEGAKALANALPSLKKLTYIDLSGNNIRSEGATALTHAINVIARVKLPDPEKIVDILEKSLHFINNYHTFERGVKASALAASYRMGSDNLLIAHIDLSLNNIHDSGILSILNILTVMPRLNTLSLVGNTIKTKTVRDKLSECINKYPDIIKYNKEDLNITPSIRTRMSRIFSPK